MKRLRFLSDYERIVRQVIAAWVVLPISVLVFSVTAALLKYVVKRDEAAIGLSLFLIIPALVLIYVRLNRQDYHFGRTKIKIKQTVCESCDVYSTRVTHLQLPDTVIGSDVAFPEFPLLAPYESYDLFRLTNDSWLPVSRGVRG